MRTTVGGKPVKFTVDEELGSASDRWQAGQEQTRWDEVSAVRTTKGAYVLTRKYISLWQGEHSSESYHVFASREELAAALDPLDDLNRRLLEELGVLDEISEEI